MVPIQEVAIVTALVTALLVRLSASAPVVSWMALASLPLVGSE